MRDVVILAPHRGKRRLLARWARIVHRALTSVVGHPGTRPSLCPPAAIVRWPHPARVFAPLPSLRPWLQLVRPPNLVTAAADVLAGWAVAGAGNVQPLPWLLGASVSLYAGGVVLNDVCDVRVDARERPERPLPSGQVPVVAAAVLAGFLLAAGVAEASRASPLGGALAAAIAALAVTYDTWSKPRRLAGPLNMGICRALNLLLGMTAVPASPVSHWPLALLPLAYVGGVTALSRGEVHGAPRAALLVSGGLMAGVIASVAALAWTVAPARGNAFSARVIAASCTLLLAWLVLPPLRGALRSPNARTIQAAVRAGILALLVLDASIAAAFGGWLSAMTILVLLPLAHGLGRAFAVT